MIAKPKSVAKTAKYVEPSTVTRLLIVSFFIALSLGLIEGADIKLLAKPFLPEPAALLTMRALMLALSVMVLVGFFRRPAALILALMVFWPSYITLFAGGDVSAFWRDLALIGGLIMSASDAKTSEDSTTSANVEDQAAEVVSLAPEARQKVEETDDGAYREDFNLVRSG